MRQQWYGDARDLVKWGVLIHLAKKHKLKRIIQVAYLRPDSQRPRLKSQKHLFPLPKEVWAHFREIKDIRRLKKVTGLDIKIVNAPFDAKVRSSYSQEVLKHLRFGARHPTIVFLDPDTGIAERDPKPKHVTRADVHEVWAELKASDWLVLYQHASRHKGWVAKKRAEFRRAIDSTQVKTFRAEGGARDVVFFCAAKR